jgi:hypothetical protein
MKSGRIFRSLLLLIAGLFLVWSLTASDASDWCRGNACDFVQLTVSGECLTVTNTSANKTVTVQWGPYDPFSLRPNQANTIMFHGQCVGTIVGAFKATFSGRPAAPAPVTQSTPVTAEPPWTSAETEVRDIMVRTCLINMPIYVVWVDPEGSIQGPIRAWANPSWPQGAAIVIPGTSTTASTRYRTAWVYAETEQGTIIGGDSIPPTAGRTFRFSEDLQSEYHLSQSSRFAAVHLTDAEWLGDVDDSYLYKAWRADLTCP